MEDMKYSYEMIPGFNLVLKPKTTRR